MPEYFDLGDLQSALDLVVSSAKPLSKQLSSAVRGKAARSAAKSLLERVVSEYSLDKKPSAAFKDVLKIYSIRYVLRANSRLWELMDEVGDEIPPPTSEGYQFIAKYGKWVVVKKQRLSESTRPVDVILYLTSVSSSIYNGFSAFCARDPVAVAIDEIPPVDGDVDPEMRVRLLAGFYRIMLDAKFPAHYGPAYDNIKPPKRIRGVRTK